MIVYKWHSINIVPIISIVRAWSNDKSLKFLHSTIELVLFGLIVHINIPFKINWCSKVVGPLWSKHRKKWYRVSNKLYPVDE